MKPAPWKLLKTENQNILSFKDDDKRDNMLSSIIKRITGEEEGTKEFFEYYDYSLNKVKSITSTFSYVLL